MKIPYGELQDLRRNGIMSRQIAFTGLDATRLTRHHTIWSHLGLPGKFQRILMESSVTFLIVFVVAEIATR